MITPMDGQPLDDPRRLAALQRSGLLDGVIDDRFDELARIGVRLLRAPVALVSILDADRQHFEGCVGLTGTAADERGTAISHSFCRHTVTSGSPVVIPDARLDERVRDNPAVGELGIIAYLGAPIVTADGNVFGSFCVIDHERHDWSESDIDAVSALARLVATEIDLKQATIDAVADRRRVVTSERLVRKVLDALVPMVGLLTPDGLVVELNRSARRHLAAGPDAPFAVPAWELPGWPSQTVPDSDDGRDVLRAAVQRAAAGETMQFDAELTPLDGRRRFVDVRLVPLRDRGGTLTNIVWSAIDVTADRTAEQERERRLAAEQRAHRRAESARRLAERLVAAGSVGEVITVLVTHSAAALDAAFANVAVAGAQPGQLELRHGPGLTDDVVDRWPILDIADSAPLAAAARTRTIVWAADPGEIVRRFPTGAADAEAAGLRAVGAVPVLGADGRVLLTIGLAWRHPQPLTDDLRTKLVAVSALAAQALTRAELFDATRAVTRELQRHLLPEVLPRPPGLEIGAVYQSAVTTLEVGGDWYDVVELGDDRLLLVVGDVVGRGVGAAAAVGQLRSALRALALFDHGPAELLERLDPFVSGIPSAYCTTIAVVEIDGHRDELHYALAGHPPPLLLAADGSTTWLAGGRSCPLGIDPGHPRPVGKHRLAPGDILVLYTDGLIERRGELLDIGLARLERSATAALGSPMQDFAQLLVDDLAAGGPTDDVCVLAVARREHQ